MKYALKLLCIVGLLCLPIGCVSGTDEPEADAVKSVQMSLDDGCDTYFGHLECGEQDCARNTVTGVYECITCVCGGGDDGGIDCFFCQWNPWWPGCDVMLCT